MNNKLKSFLMGMALIAIIVADVFFVVLTYRANEQTTVDTYIFQMDNETKNRVGPLQNIDDMSPEVLRDKLIQKYVADYFKVFPGTVTLEQNNTIRMLSSAEVYKKWSDSEAKNINNMAAKKMFRNVCVSPEHIRPLDRYGLFEVPYTIRTWLESNNMNSDIKDEGVLYMRIWFEPGVDPEINIRQYLQEGKNPAGLFNFQVLDIR